MGVDLLVSNSHLGHRGTYACQNLLTYVQKEKTRKGKDKVFTKSVL